MSRLISELPQEMLQEIFKYLKGKEAVRCRLVCSRWLQAIDDLSDKAWKEFCVLDFEDCYEAYEKTNITWWELYKCLTLWQKLPSAKMSVKVLVCPEMVQFCLLRDRLGIAQCEKTNMEDERGREVYERNCDKIVYYDLDALEKKTETIFDFPFYSYSENDMFITVIAGSWQLCVIPKSTNEKVFVGKLPEDVYYEEYALFENSVYFKNSENLICMSKLVDVDGRSTMVTESLCEFKDEIVTMAYINENHINILAETGAIYCLKHNELKVATTIFTFASNVIKIFLSYGFDWCRRSVQKWIEIYLFETIAESKDTLWNLGDIFIMGTEHRVLNIYHKHDFVEKHSRHNIEPTRCVDLNKLFEFQDGDQKIHQIDAVEVPNAHKVIVLAVDKLIVLEFLHEEEERKRKAYDDVDVSECRVKRLKTFK